MATDLRFLVLGSLAVTGTAGQVRIDSRKQRLLLAALLVAAPRAVPSGRLVEVLWDDELPDDPGSALQVHVSRLRRTLAQAPGVLVTEPHGYRLAVDAGQLDAARFENALNEARRAATPEESLELVSSALDLWRGAAFAEFAELPFARAEAARLEELRVAALELRAEALVGVARPAEALAIVEPLIADHPLRERPRELLMRALSQLGRRADALAAYQDFRLALSRELGLDPSSSLARLEAQLLAQDPDGPRCPEALEPAPAAPNLDITYLTVGRGRMAVGATGKGPTLVVLPGFVSHLGTIGAGRDFRSPLLARLATRLRLVAFDRFGTGLSAAPVDDFSLGTSVDDAEHVIAGSCDGPVALLGISASGPVAVALAARRPDLVTHLVLLGTYASGPATFDRNDVCRSILDLVRSHWGLGSKLLTDLMYPTATAEFARLFARGQREAATPEVAAGYLEAMFSVDVRGLLAEIAAPALVVHYTGDRAIPFRGGRELAAGLPGARFVPLGGSMHLPEGEDAARVAREIVDFVTTGPVAP